MPFKPLGTEMERLLLIRIGNWDQNRILFGTYSIKIKALRHRSSWEEIAW